MQRLCHLPHHVLAAEWILRAQGAFGVVAPFTVHEKPVVMRARFQFHRGSPDAVGTFMQTDGMFLPMSKITHQLYARRAGSGERERLFLAPAAIF